MANALQLIFRGSLPFAAFHLAKPAETVRALGDAPRGAIWDDMMSRFVVKAMAYLKKPARFRLLNGLAALQGPKGDIKLQFSNEGDILGEEFSEYGAYALMVYLIGQNGVAMNSVLWVEQNKIEAFIPHVTATGYVKRLITTKIVPFLKSKWIPQQVAVETFVYSMPNGLEPSNLWNLYFLFLRALRSQAEVQKAFSVASDLGSLVEKRDLAVQTAGRLIAACAERRDPSNDKAAYKRYFGPKAIPIQLNQREVKNVKNVFMRCRQPSNPLWERFLYLAPAMASGAGPFKDKSATTNDANRVVNTGSWPANLAEMWRPFVEVEGAPPMYFERP